MSQNNELTSKSDVLIGDKFDGVPNSLDQESTQESKTQPPSEATKKE